MGYLGASICTVGVACMLTVACGGAGEASSQCSPGATQACVGPGSCDGTRTCNTDGTWSACTCSSAGDGGTGDPTVQGCSDVVATGLPALIDDLDDGDGDIPANDGRRGFWGLYSDGTGTVSPEPAPGCESGIEYHFEPTDGAACMTGEGLSDWGAQLVVNLNPSTECGGLACRYDVTVYTGVRFTVSGSVSGEARFAMQTRSVADVESGGTCQEDCWDKYGATFDVGPEPQTIEFAFADLSQEGWGMSLAWDPSDVTAICFDLRLVDGEPLSFTDFCVDDVEFF